MSAKIIGIAVLALFALLAKLMPYRAPAGALKKDMATLTKEYQKWEYLALAVLFLSVPLMTFSLGYLFEWLVGLSYHHDPAMVYQALPERAHFFGAAMVMSLGLVGIPMDLLYSSLLKERYEEYTLFTNLKHGFDGWKVFRPMAWTICLAGTLFLVLLSDYYIEIYPDKIKVNDLMSLKEKSYQYDDLSGIYFVPFVKTKDSIRSSPHYYVLFKNGDYWNTNSGVNNEAKEQEIIEYLSKNSKTAIKTMDYDLEN